MLERVSRGMGIFDLRFAIGNLYHHGGTENTEIKKLQRQRFTAETQRHAEKTVRYFGLLPVSASCMFKTHSKRSTTARRARVATSAARSHASTTTGPRPIASRSATIAAEQGPSQSRVHSPEQPTEPSGRHPPPPVRSHLQGRDARMTQLPSQPVSPLFAGIDVAKEKLDLARSDSGELLTVSNDDRGIRQIVKLLAPLAPRCIVVESTGGLERPLLEALLDARLPVALVNPGRVRYFAIGCGIPGQERSDRCRRADEVGRVRSLAGRHHAPA